jgi:hypothetical protein
VALIQSGADATLLTVDPTSKAARVTLYDASGNPLPTLSVDVTDRAARLLGSVSLGVATGKTLVGKPGTLATVATGAQQVVTYTVTAGKTLYLCYLTMFCRLTTVAATATNFGTATLELPSGTAFITENLAGPGFSQPIQYIFEEPLPVAAGTVIRVTVTPSATTGFTWTANFGGYEK